MKHTQICTTGGYNEVGRNMTSINIGGETVICDIGINVQKLVEYQQKSTNQPVYTRAIMDKIEAIPNLNKLQSWLPTVKGIAISHCHLDHIGGIKYLAPEIKAPVIASPYTMEVIRGDMRSDDISIPNKMKTVNPDGTIQLSKKLKLEYISIPHSTPECALMAIHSPKGVYLYATDWKFDNTPVIGKKPNYKRLKELANKGVKALVIDSLYSQSEGKTPSEMIARELLRDAMTGVDNSKAAIFTTCFGSHIARLKSIIEFSKKINRKVVVLGRSFGRYVGAAENTKITKLTNQAEFYTYRNEIKRKITEIEKKGPHKYVVVCTGGQGEPNSVLSRIMNSEYKFKFYPEDEIIFSNKLIPVQPNIRNREYMEKKLKEMGARIFTDIHVSGHCSREDIREMINLTNPENIIPCHGNEKLMKPGYDLAEDMGYKKDRDIHLMSNGEKIIIE